MSERYGSVFSEAFKKRGYNDNRYKKTKHKPDYKKQANPDYFIMKAGRTVVKHDVKDIREKSDPEYTRAGYKADPGAQSNVIKSGRHATNAETAKDGKTEHDANTRIGRRTLTDTSESEILENKNVPGKNGSSEKTGYNADTRMGRKMLLATDDPEPESGHVSSSRTVDADSLAPAADTRAGRKILSVTDDSVYENGHAKSSRTVDAGGISPAADKRTGKKILSIIDDSVYESSPVTPSRTVNAGGISPAADKRTGRKTQSAQAGPGVVSGRTRPAEMPEPDISNSSAASRKDKAPAAGTGTSGRGSLFGNAGKNRHADVPDESPYGKTRKVGIDMGAGRVPAYLANNRFLPKKKKERHLLAWFGISGFLIIIVALIALLSQGGKQNNAANSMTSTAGITTPYATDEAAMGLVSPEPTLTPVPPTEEPSPSVTVPSPTTSTVAMNEPTPTPAPTATPKPTSTPRPTATPTPHPSPTASPTPRPTATPTPTPTATPTPTPTVTPTPEPTPDPTPEPTSEPTPDPTDTSGQ